MKFEISKIDLDDFVKDKEFKHPKVGAKVTFEGIIRDYNEGEDVESLEFDVYDELASNEGNAIVDEAIKKFSLYDAYCVHRIGHLQVTDKAVIVIATAGHRQEAFEGARYIIDELKKRVPVWKKEHYKNKDPKWLKGHVPEV